MRKLSDLLTKFHESLKESGELKNYIIGSLEKEGIKGLTLDDININKKNIYIKTTPIKKSEIFLKQKNILKLLNENPLLKEIEKIS